MSGPGDWLQFYHQNLTTTAAPPPSDQSTSEMVFVDRVSDAIASANTGASTGLNPERRVAKPVRRRSRTSRRTPTTLLNTDTTNFRAMVQQFTGGPTPPFASSISPNFSLGFGAIPQSNSGLISPPSGYPLQFYHHNPQPFMIPASAHGGEFLQRLSAAKPGNGGVAADGFLMENAISSQIPPAGASADSSNKSNAGSGGGFLF
ncbi:VQ motif-containing protein 22-like [Cucurbita moschata]|uniref:VQ motif-containing protein 22-like n=1 Tax=Cucurbita moschata TaxID=3662 RepID=A0A6J1ETK0_CUCMO|nr:VQ motif-containing protein 22-like [Cucurbita moschata]